MPSERIAGKDLKLSSTNLPREESRDFEKRWMDPFVISYRIIWMTRTRVASLPNVRSKVITYPLPSVLHCIQV